jgi:hypothetical protein
VSLADSFIPADGVCRWLQARAADHLEWIDLSNNGWDRNDIIDLLRPDLFSGQLRELRLDGMSCPSWIAPRPLTLAPNLQALHSLLDEHESSFDVAWFGRKPQDLGRLRRWHVRPSSRFLQSEGGLAAVAPYVTHLDLSNSTLDLDLWGVVGSAGSWSKLRAVDLRYTHLQVGEAGLARFADLPFLAELNLERMASATPASRCSPTALSGPSSSLLASPTTG